MKNSQPLRKEGYMEREERQAIYQVNISMQRLDQGLNFSWMKLVLMRSF